MSYQESLRQLREHAEAYIRENGNLDVRQDYVAPDGYPLGMRIHGARAARFGGTLSAERFALLDELGLDWTPRNPDKWLPEARQHARQYGDLKVHQEHITPNGTPLGWRIRSARISLRGGTIAPQLKEALDLIDPCWHITYRSPAPTHGLDCAVPRCREDAVKHRLCARHLEHLAQHGAPVFTYAPDVACPVAACDEPPAGQGWCKQHQAQIDLGHGRTAYRIQGRWRGLECGGRCEVCLADRARQQGDLRRKQAEERLPFTARRDVVGALWGGKSLDQACEMAGMSSRELFGMGQAIPEFGEAVDAALMGTRDAGLKHGKELTYRVHRCRCPECRAAKAQYR